MTGKHVLWADSLLERVRASADPTAVDEARNLAAIEQRLSGVPSGALNGGGGAAGDHRPKALLPAQSPSAAPPLAPVRGSRLGAAAKVGRWLAFGLATGVVGYLLGRADGQREPISGAAASSMLSATHDAALGEQKAGPDAPMAPSPALLAASATAPNSSSPSAQNDNVSDAARTRSRPSRSNPKGRLPHAATSGSILRSPSPPPPSDNGLGIREALELLRRAEAAVRRSDGLEAMMWLSDLDRRAPKALLIEERLVTETLAACMLGDADRARKTLRELKDVNAESIYRARLEGSCVAALIRER
jgi:hypothetical protein